MQVHPQLRLCQNYQLLETQHIHGYRRQKFLLLHENVMMVDWIGWSAGEARGVRAHIVVA